jgi:Methyltransferase domain
MTNLRSAIGQGWHGLAGFMAASLRGTKTDCVPKAFREEIRRDPRNIAAWVALVHRLRMDGNLSPHAARLAEAHELHPSGHAVHAFAEGIIGRAGAELDAFSHNPGTHLDEVVELLVKWKTTLQCAYSHDMSKGYFVDAEAMMSWQWDQIIFPLISSLDFSITLDLACGHGRNSEFLRRLTKELHLVDINQSCIDACRDRFGSFKDGTRFHYHVTDGNHLGMIARDSVSLVYTWDSMVHFDKLIVRDYVGEIRRVLKPGGCAFLHHSNYGEKAPDSDWARNSGTRSDMSARLMREYASASGLVVMRQEIQGRAQGWGEDELDCVSILRKPV